MDEKDMVTIKTWDLFSGSDTGEAWLMIELITKTGLATWNCQGQIGSFRILWFIHYGDGEASQDLWLALVLPGNRFYGLESVPFSISFMSHKQLRIIYFAIMHEEDSFREWMHWNPKPGVDICNIRKKNNNVFFMMHNLVLDILHEWKQNNLSGAVNMFCKVILKPAAVILKLLEEYPLEAGRKYFKCISPAVTRMLLEFHLYFQTSKIKAKHWKGCRKEMWKTWKLWKIWLLVNELCSVTFGGKD